MREFCNNTKFVRYIYYTFLAGIILLGIVLRFKTFMINRPLWHDECSLALNIIELDAVKYFSPLKYGQAAPPLFMLLTKTITSFAGIKEFSLRILPFICSIISIPIFWQFSKTVLKNKFWILAANFLFAVNYNIIYYSQEFKQYSVELMICMVLYRLYLKSDLKKLQPLRSLSLGIISAAASALAFPAIFLTGAFYSYEIIQHRKDSFKNLIIFTSPIILYWIGYILLTVLPQMGAGYLQNYWTKGFIDFNILNFLELLKINFLYWFNPNQTIFLIGTFFLAGIIIAGINIRNKIKTKEYTLILLTLFFIILASFLHLYPFIDRVSLYFIPFIIILVLIPFDTIPFNKKILLGIAILLFLSTFCQYNHKYINAFFNPEIFAKYDSRTLMKNLADKYDYKNYILINDASLTDYGYYSKLYNLNTDKLGIINFSAFSEENILKILNSLPSGTYWFYFPNDYSHSPAIPALKKWKANKNISEELEIKGSYLLKVEI